MMKHAHILHNPGAGDEEHSEKELRALIEEKGFKCSYSSLKDDNWKEDFPENDFLIIAGGDGTVRKVIKHLLKKQVDFNFPIGLIPIGSANNIARTLKINEDIPVLIEKWHSRKLKKFTIGKVNSASGSLFFLESFGYGLFPSLMKEMKNVDRDLVATPETKIRTGLEVMQSVLQRYQSSKCKIKIDGSEFNDKFIMVEVMNTKSFGPNLNFAPLANPGDGLLEVVLIYENQREKLASYIEKRLQGKELDFEATVLTGTNIAIEWEGEDIHADDEIIEDIDKKETVIEIFEKPLQFLMP